MIDAGHLGSSGERRVLLTSNNAYSPELTSDIPEMLGADHVLKRFDSVANWNRIIEPAHPKDFSVSSTQAPMVSRFVRDELGIRRNEEVELVVDSLPFAPAGTIGALFPHSSMSVHSDGLMSFGPTRQQLRQSISQRLERLHYTDFVPGLSPQLMREENIELVALPPEPMRTVFCEFSDDAARLLPHDLLKAGDDTAIILGQYLANLGVIDSQAEVSLHTEMIKAAHDRGFRTVVFKPHPASGTPIIEQMHAYADELKIDFRVIDVPVSAETLFEIVRPGIVISCFSTGLATAKAMFNIPALAVGTGEVLAALTPFENSNRVPLTIADHLYSDSKDEKPYSLPDLVKSVAYCMQPAVNPDLRSIAEELLAGLSSDTRTRYFKRRRLTKLELPGRLPAKSRAQTTPARAKKVVRRVGRKAFDLGAGLNIRHR